MKITKYEHPNYIEYRNEKGETHNINDDPAVIYGNGTKEWVRNNKRHRTKGPASIYPDGEEIWFYEGINITNKVNQLITEERISSDWRNWTEEDEFLFVLLVS